MIPTRAIFFWEGGPMSWLRDMSFETFRLHNHDWTVEIIDGSRYGPGVTGRYLEIANRSDRARYAELSERGGIYFDTDIIFIKPVPERLLAVDEFVPFDDNGKPAHIAMLGCVPGSSYFSLLSKVSEAAATGTRPLAYQSLGIDLLSRFRPGLEVSRVPCELVVPVPWSETSNLWADPSPILLPDSCIGVHWFGGDLLSQEMERVACESWMEKSDCLVARALKAGVTA